MLVYKCPGNHQCQGGTFSYKKIDETGDSLKDAIADGWFPTLPEAIAGVLSTIEDPEKLEEIPSDDAMPTRQEMEIKAKELGVSFRSDIGDAKLLERIEEALKE